MNFPKFLTRQSKNIFLLSIVTALFFPGCGKKQNPPAANAPASSPSASSSTLVQGMPMMQEDPLSIKSVEGEIREVHPDQLIVFTKKNVTLKFAWDKQTSITPAGSRLVPGAHVKIMIDHIAQGMRAKAIEVSK